MPEGMEGITFFEPGTVGTEAAYAAHLHQLREQAQRRAASDTMPPVDDREEHA